MAFCITCPPTPLSALNNDRWRARESNRGTQIFIFKIKSRTRAVDWVWNIWYVYNRIESKLPQID